MNRLNLALPAFIVFVLFAPNFVSANGLEKLLTTEPVEKTVQTTEGATNIVSETVKETIEEPSLSKPVSSTVEVVKEVVEPVKAETTSIAAPVTKPVEHVVKETGNALKETTGKIDESVVKPIKPISGSVLKPVKDTVETVKERDIVSEAVDAIEATGHNTEKKLKESPVTPVIKEKPSETSVTETTYGNQPTTQKKVIPVGVEESVVVQTAEPDHVKEKAYRLQGKYDPNEMERTIRKVREPTNSSPLSGNKLLKNQAVPAQTIQVGTPSVSVKSSSDLGVSAFLESLKLDLAAEISWSNSEEAGKSQWSHAPPGKPPKSLSFL